jgi:hypothetical protein
MGMCAEIVAFGPYSPDIADYLEYPAEFYRGTKTGALVVRTLFGIAEGSSASREFARCLGISDPWDFNQHKIDSSRIDFVALQFLFKTLAGGEDYSKDAKALAAFKAAGFQFVFAPCG